MAMWLAAAENNRYGEPSGFADAIHIGRLDGGYLELEGPRIAVSWKRERKKLRIGTHIVPCAHYVNWYGNMAWNAYAVHSLDLVGILNYLLGKKLAWQCIGGPSVLFEACKRGVVTREEWQVTA
jgi:hypothetical protein